MKYENVEPELQAKIEQFLGPNQVPAWERKNPYGHTLDHLPEGTDSQAVFLVDPTARFDQEHYHVSLSLNDNTITASLSEGYYYPSDEGMKHSIRPRKFSCPLADFTVRLNAELAAKIPFPAPPAP